MVFMPNIRTAKPIRISATWRTLRFLIAFRSTIAARAVIAASASVLSSFSA